MAEEDIWVSSVLNNSSLTVGTEINRDEPAWKAIEQGRDPLPEELPLRIYAHYRDETFEKKLPHLFFGAGGIKISPQLVSILNSMTLERRRFDQVNFSFSTGKHWRTFSILYFQHLKIGLSCWSMNRDAYAVARRTDIIQIQHRRRHGVCPMRWKMMTLPLCQLHQTPLTYGVTRKRMADCFLATS